MICEAEIIIGRKIEKSFSADLDARALRGIHAAQFAEQVLSAQRVEPEIQSAFKRIHLATDKHR